MKRIVATLALAAVALASAACGSSAASQPSGPAASVDPNAPAVSAKNLAFTPTEVKVPAAKAFQLVFNNEEGLPHNVAIYTDASASTKLFGGDIVTGPTTKVYDVPALQAGTYFFRCDVHPDMKGAIQAQ